jgi:uncharacterized protein
MDQARLIPPAALDDFAVAPFVPRAPWWGGDLQTLSNYFRRRAALHSYAQGRLLLPLGDGTGDRLSGALSRPLPGGPPLPLVVLIHGLSGDERSFYMRRTAAHLLGLGYPVLRLNMRGAGPSRPLCRLQYHAGRSDDLGMALEALPPALKTAGVVAVGFSLGGNMLLKFLGERGAAAPLRAAVSISAPIDLALTSRRMRQRRNYLYQSYLLRDLRIDAVAPISETTEEERRLVARVRSIWEYDEVFTAPRNGYPSAAAYYERNSAQHFLGAVGVPTLVIHAIDDPWVPSDPYSVFDWSSNRHLVPLLPPRGGHVGFHGRDRSAPWHDLAVAQFFATALTRI